MLPIFFDREEELKWLENIYKEEGFKVVVIYGRRRVGKTELLKKFLENKKGIYFLATDESMEENIKSFKEKVSEITKQDYFLKLETNSFHDIFRYFSKEVGKERIIVIIDEFPYLLSVKKGLLSLFQKIIDEILINTNFLLILCGSSMSIMESEVLGYRTPLYGRNVNSWKLLPFDFATVFRIIGDIEKAVEAYSVFGGVPYYIKFYNKNLGILENIKINFLTKGRNLYDEPLILLREEFRESRVYRLLLKYISLGYKSIGKLCSASGLDKNNAIKYLSSLEEVGLITHVVPFGMKRKGIYEVSDSLFRFWFRFVYPYRDRLEMGNVNAVLNIIKKQLNEHVGLCFEYIIQELLEKGIVPGFEDLRSIYKWWHKDKEIDIVALNDQTKQILFCECKWQSRVNAKKVCKELAEKTSYIQWYNEQRKEYFAIFAKSFSKKINEFEGRKVFCFDLRDLERTLKKFKYIHLLNYSQGE
jgi:hypothetical protein